MIRSTNMSWGHLLAKNFANFWILSRKVQFNQALQPKIPRFWNLSKQQKTRNHDDKLWRNFLSCKFFCLQFIRDIPQPKILWSFIFWAKNGNLIGLRSLKSRIFEICQKTRKLAKIALKWAVFEIFLAFLRPKWDSQLYFSIL